MKSNLILNVVVILISFWSFVPGAAGQADERLMEVMKLSQQGKPKEALAAGREYLKDLRETLPEADHPAIGMAAVAVGVAASKAGEHEEAVRLLREGLPIVNRMRAGQLWAEELSMSEPLVSSLQALKRTDEALTVLEDLLARTRKELARRAIGGGLKLDQPGGPAVALDALLVNEDSLAALLERSGTVKLELKQWDQAEKDLREAEQILRRIHPDEQQARLVKLREGWEQAARAQGKSIRPQLVGRFSMPRTIRIEGNSLILTDEIRTALTRSSAYVLASHPCAEFEGYLAKLQSCLEIGYLAAGFPESKVKVDWDDKQDAVVARITEGPRFKAGEIRIKGAETIPVERLLEALVLDPDAEEKPASRAEAAYQNIVAQKVLPGEQAVKDIMEIFPENFTKPADGDEGNIPSFPGLLTDSESYTLGIWERGRWVDCQQSFLDQAGNVLRAAYGKEGLFFPKFELKLIPGAKPDRMDLSVQINEEGPLVRLGKLHVAGNRTNTREELIAYLELEEGMELRGDYIGRVKRSLFESGRFLGWQVVSRRTPDDPGRMDLLITVAEEWEAPPLSQPLTREQDAMLKFAKWMNSEAGEESDLVISASRETQLGPVRLSMALGREAMSLSADGLGHHFRMMAEQDKEVEFIIQADQGSTFRAFFPVSSSPLSAFLNLFRTPGADPFASTGSIGMGLGFSSQGFNLLKFSVDPAAALSACASKSGSLMRSGNGEVIMEIDGMTLRIDEQNGHLISAKGISNGFAIEGYAEAGGFARIRDEMKGVSRSAENWTEGRNPFSLYYLAMGYMWELLQDEGLKENGSITGLSLGAAAERSKRWDPLAVFLGDVTGAVCGGFASIRERMAASKDANFLIPIDTEELTAKLQAGSMMNLLLGLGTYDMLAEYIEPGTWPDLVSREILFYLDGKPFYQNQSIETLLEDESMGPLGSLICARLLKYAGNPAAARFVTKARAEVNDEGFAKDWTPLLRGTASDDSIGWKILKAIRQLDDQKTDGFLPADPPEFRSVFKSMVAEAGRMKPGTNAETFRPVMASVWENIMKTVVEGMIDDMEESLNPKMDPAIVAATVNGMPVFRSVVRLMDTLRENMLIQQTFPVLREAWKLDDLESDGPADSSLADCVTTLVLAQQMWSKGQSALPEFVEQWSDKIAKALGEDGWDRIAGMGLTKDQYKWWVGTLIAAQVYGGELAKKEISEKEVRAFHKSHGKLFGAGEQEVRLYTIRLKLEGDGTDQLQLAQNIRERVVQAEAMEDKVIIFMEQAKQHSGETDTKPGGERGWVQLSDELSPAVAAEIAKVPDPSLSDVMRIELGGQDYLYLALIPEKKRPGKAKPFEQMAPYLRALALIDRERKLLRKQADVQLLDEPPVNGLAKRKTGEKGIMALAAGLMSEKSNDEGKDGKKKNTGEVKEKLSLELITRKAAEGSARHIYLLGTCVERGLTPEIGIQAAIKYYEQAASAGERRAMLRLSEIHRIGRGVDRDDGKAREWKERAIACPRPTDE